MAHQCVQYDQPRRRRTGLDHVIACGTALVPGNFRFPWNYSIRQLLPFIKFMNASILKEDAEDFSLLDVFLFFGRSLRLLLVTSALGLGVGLVAYLMYPAYKGSILLPNISDPMYIKRLQFIMPRMAASLDDSDAMKEKLMREKFWTENFFANYVIKKQDFKDLKDLQDSKKDETSSPTLTLSLKERSLDDLHRNMDYFVNYVKDKSTIYYLEDLSTGIKYQSAIFIANYEKTILELSNEKKYTLKKIASLESIGQQFKGASFAQSSQLFDLKDGGSKFLPVNVQLIALKKELSDIDLQLERNQDAFDENQVRVKLQSVIAENLKSCGNGLKCIENILEGARKEELSASKTPGTIIGFKRFISQLESARSQNANGFSQLIAMNVEKTSSSLFLLGGLIAGLLFGVLGALVYEAIKNRSATPVPV